MEDKREYVVDDPVETIRKVMADEGVNQSQLAEKMGAVRQNVSQMLNRGNTAPRYDSFAKMVAALGCEVILRKIEK